MPKITVIAAAISSNIIILYDNKGKDYYFPRDSEEARYIVNEVLPELARNKKAIFDPDSTKLDLFKNFSDEELSFYYICKNTLEALKTSADILKNIIKDAEQKNISPTNTSIVAVVKDNAIAGIEQLKPYFNYANQTEDYEGTKNLIKRVAKLANVRMHSATDLLRFLANADLPLTPEGDIIAYKILKRSGDKYVDVASKNVFQQVGSIVCMDESLVDPDRSADCSQGLHIARRDYLQFFHGDVCVLVRIRPEDVIAVPISDPRKIRVCKYQILQELPESCFNLLKDNQPITECPEGQTILQNAFNHKYDKVIEEVRITAPYGGGLIITPLTNKAEKKTVKTVDKVISLDSVQDDSNLSEEQMITAGTFYSAPRKVLHMALKDNTMTTSLAKLADEWRRKSKKSWKALGLSEDQIKIINSYLA